MTVGAIWLALRVTPLQTVSAAGQTAQVGATLPNASMRGPGELDLFGQVMATKPATVALSMDKAPNGPIAHLRSAIASDCGH